MKTYEKGTKHTAGEDPADIAIWDGRLMKMPPACRVTILGTCGLVLQEPDRIKSAQLQLGNLLYLAPSLSPR